MTACVCAKTGIRQPGMSADVTSRQKMRKNEVHFPEMRENFSDICV